MTIVEGISRRWRAVLIVTTCFLCSANAQYVFGPFNITRTVGERNTFIPCPFGGPAAVTWKIGNWLYSTSTLPRQYTSISSGLIINVVQGNMSGLTFQCLTPSGIELHDIVSSVGTLTVLPSQTEGEQLQGVEYVHFQPQPANITQKPGDVHVFIPCPFGGPSIPTWKIGDYSYSYSTLPKNFQVVRSGLIIKSIDSSMSGLTFQCLSPTGNGITVDGSAIGKLTVTVNMTNVTNNEDQCLLSSPLSAQLYLDHQKFLFTKSYAIFAWKIISDDQPCGSNVNYFINSTGCIQQHQARNYTIKYNDLEIDDTSIQIYAKDLYDKSNKLLYYSISVANDDGCARGLNIRTKIALRKDEVTIQRFVTPYDKYPSCIDVPPPSTSRGTVRLVLPNRSTNSDNMYSQKKDIICTVDCQLNEVINGCCSLDKKCMPALQGTIFNNSVTLCRKSNDSQVYHFCISHPTVEMNETKVHFYYERSCTSTRDIKNIAVSEYVRAVEFIVKVPPSQPNVTVDDITGQICIQEQSGEMYPVDNYTVVITDITDYEIFRNESLTPGCIFVDSLLLSECAPFYVAVEGYNRDGGSMPVLYVVDSDTNVSKSSCECANKKVHLSFEEVNPSKTSIEYQVTCHSNVSTSVVTNFTVYLENENNYNKTSNDSLSGSCSALNGKEDEFKGLGCSETYNITAYFVYPNGTVSDCQLAQRSMVTTDYSWISPHCTRNLLILSSSVSVCIVALLIIIIIMIIVFVCKKIKQRNMCCHLMRRNYTLHDTAT